MMEAHVTAETLAQWKRGDVPPAEVVSIARHLETCAACRAVAEQQWNARAIDLDLQALDEHPGLEDLIAGKAASHLLSCTRCREDLDDHRAATARPGRWIGLAAAAAAVVA